MGWNDILDYKKCKLLDSIPDPKYYFLHSYYFDADNNEHIEASFDYGSRMPCIVRNNKIFGVQFHPEKVMNTDQFIKEFFFDELIIMIKPRIIPCLLIKKGLVKQKNLKTINILEILSML